MKTALYYKTFILSIFVTVCSQSELYSQNLLDLSGWTVGAGSSGIFNVNGLPSENSREWGEGPHGKGAVLWKAAPSGDGQADGGWSTPVFPVVHTNMYRFSVWIKKTYSNSGTSYLGCGSVANLDGTANSNPYFWAGDLPELNKWYLLVGYVHGSNDASMVSYGGLYDGLTGAKLVNCTDFKFTSGVTHSVHRSFLFYDANLNDRQYFYAPRVEVVNGNEPTIAALLGLNPISSDSAYFSGSVGIKTPNPGVYDLAVKGKIRAQEIKVEMANWPDYVFAKDYQLPSLTETEKYIKEKGHLPNIPTANEVEANGVELGEMNRKLLQKIEELTLYIINQEKRIKDLEILIRRKENDA